MADRPRKTPSGARARGPGSRAPAFAAASGSRGGVARLPASGRRQGAPKVRRIPARCHRLQRQRGGTAGPHSGAGEAAAVASSGAQAGVRISKLMAERGLCSRRNADEYIARGWVFVDGRRVSELGTRADPAAVITLDRRRRRNQQSRMTILLHKPMGYVSGQPEPGFTPAVT
jgi:23S rRNA pseudouridine2604 synthase